MWLTFIAIAYSNAGFDHPSAYLTVDLNSVAWLSVLSTASNETMGEIYRGSGDGMWGYCSEFYSMFMPEFYFMFLVKSE